MSPPTRGRPRSIEDARILAATRDALVTVGPGVTVREIARRADVSEGTVFRRFPSKSALVAAACGYDCSVLIEPFRALESQPDLDLATALDRLVFGFRRVREALAPHLAADRHRRGRARSGRDTEELVRVECTHTLARVLARTAPCDDAALDWATALVAVLWLDDPLESARGVRPLLAALVAERSSRRAPTAGGDARP
jgi:AcrR family transcriptional regulator